ncbi:hypothetical protein HDU79_001871, partial [Rhizoclosmatium sp. JEL0117]
MSKLNTQDMIDAKDIVIESMQSKITTFEGCLQIIEIEILSTITDLDKATNTSQELGVEKFKRTLPHLHESRTHIQNVILKYDLCHSKLIEERKQLTVALMEVQDHREELKDLLNTTFAIDGIKTVFESEEHIFTRNMMRWEIAVQSQNQQDKIELKRYLFRKTKQLLVASNEHLYAALNHWETAYEACCSGDSSRTKDEWRKVVKEIAKAITLISDAKKIDISLPSWAELGSQHFEVLDL